MTEENDRQKTDQGPEGHFILWVLCWSNRTMCFLAVALTPLVFFREDALAWVYPVWEYAAFVLIVYLLFFRKNDAAYKAAGRTPPWL